MLPEAMRRLVRLLAKLPGVGEKTAQRYALELVRQPQVAEELGAELATLASRVGPCARCGHLAEGEPGAERRCAICQDPRRDPSSLCVVGRVQDLLALERAGAFRGRYLVLGRLLSPLDGVGPAELPLERLLARVAEEGVREVILATPASVDGEATALYLGRELRAAGVAVTRIASGIPHGGELEYADPITLGRAFEGRRQAG